MEPVSKDNLELLHLHLRQYAANIGLSGQLTNALLWVAEDFGEIADISGLTELSTATLLRSLYPGNKWAWRWCGTTADGTSLSAALLCDNQALAITANLDGETALEAVADLEYNPDVDIDATMHAYNLVRPASPREHCPRSSARVALAGTLSLAICRNSFTIPDTVAGL